MTRRHFFSLSAASVVAAGASDTVPARPDFSGRWKADMEDSDFASLPKPTTFVRLIDHDNLHLTISVEAVSHEGKPYSGELRFGLDGEESVNEVGGATVVGFARPLGSHLLVHTSRVVEGTRFDIDELWTLSSDGRTLTIEAAVISKLGDEGLLVVLHKDRP